MHNIIKQLYKRKKTRTTWHVHVLLLSQLAVIHHFAHDIVIAALLDDQDHGAVLHQNPLAFLHALGQLGIGDGNHGLITCYLLKPAKTGYSIWHMSTSLGSKNQPWLRGCKQTIKKNRSVRSPCWSWLVEKNIENALYPIHRSKDLSARSQSPAWSLVQPSTPQAMHLRPRARKIRQLTMIRLWSGAVCLFYLGGAACVSVVCSFVWFYARIIMRDKWFCCERFGSQVHIATFQRTLKAQSTLRTTKIHQATLSISLIHQNYSARHQQGKGGNKPLTMPTHLKIPSKKNIYQHPRLEENKQNRTQPQTQQSPNHK